MYIYVCGILLYQCGELIRLLEKINEWWYYIYIVYHYHCRCLFITCKGMYITHING